MPLPPVSASWDGAGAPLLAGGSEGPAALRPLTSVVIDALEDGAARRRGPLPRGGPREVADAVASALDGGVLPERGTGPREALDSLVRAVAEGAADPADPLCAAHLHCPPVAVAAAADFAASALNPSLDSWDQAPAASELESRTCRALARLVYGEGSGCDGVRGGGAGPDALVTTGGTESNQLGVLLARERLGPEVRVVCGENAHHSVHRAAWLLGLPEPVRAPAPGGVLCPRALRAALSALGPRPKALVVATAGTTDAGAVDPLAELADVAAEFGARLHVDAAYGGMLLFSDRLRPRLAGLERADSVTLDLHKLGWQPAAAGLFTVPAGRDLAPLAHRADYLNAGDDSDAGLPDLLGRSLRTTRRPDVLKVAVTLRALGRSGMAALVERTCHAARSLAGLVASDPRLELFGTPQLSTVLFRPAGADGAAVASVRRRLLAEGRAVLGRADMGGRKPSRGGAGDGSGTGRGPGGASGGRGAGGDGRGGASGGGAASGSDLWLKATLLNPCVQRSDLERLLDLVCEAAAGVPPQPGRARVCGPPPPPPAGPAQSPPPAAAAPLPRPAPAASGSAGSTTAPSSTARSHRS